MSLDESFDYVLKMLFFLVYIRYVFCMGYCIFLAVDFVCWFFSGLYYVVVFINKVDVYKLEVQFFIFFAC